MYTGLLRSEGGRYGWKPSSSSNFSARTRLPVERFEATVSQSTVPFPPLSHLGPAPISPFLCAVIAATIRRGGGRRRWSVRNW